MLIKYKTEPTIIVLSPNSANLIKILTQFVYSINIRYFSPPPLPCPVTLQGITNSMGERLLFNPLPLCFRREYRGSARRARGLIQAKAQSPIPPLSGGEDARETEGKGRGLSEQSEFRSPRRRDRSDKPISSTTAAALLGSSFSLLRRMNK